MIFGKIEYLNLLPFHVFMKRFTRSSQEQMSMHYKRGVPSKINKKFISHEVDAAFISSVKARKYKNIGLGIIAKKEVQSVIVVPNARDESDTESATSNILAKALSIKGKVLIGDKALAYSLRNDDYIDLAKEWHTRYNSPFVFALLCYHKDKQKYKRIQKNFLKQKVKIPRYILVKASKKTAIKENDILEYLKLISYKYDKKAEHGLKKFYSLLDN
ncbi:MAG: MqnA/MqnD/SBP family protein [Sulfurimonas sp.]|nr:MqnA/MqnD/SBP family protein [Sulfurimonas sp.]MDQ7061772.1 MqnA/MqnD/SBP family protein [Sulfurimonas sp.]